MSKRKGRCTLVFPRRASSIAVGVFFLVPAGVERLSVEFARPGNWVISCDAFNLAVKVAGPDNEREDRGAGERN